MRRLLKYLAYLVILGIIALSIYAYFNDLPPRVREVEVGIPVPGASGQTEPAPPAGTPEPATSGHTAPAAEAPGGPVQK